MGSRPISEALSPAMRRALVAGRTPQPSTARGLASRRLVCPGSSAVRLAPTPLGRQVAAMLADLHTARQALALVVQLAERLRRVVVSPDVQAGVGAVLETAVRALARTRPWV